MPMGEPRCMVCGGESLAGAVHVCRTNCPDCEGLRHRLAAAERRLKPLMEVVGLALMRHAETGCKDGCWFPKDAMEAAFEAATRDLVCICADFDPDASRCVRCGGRIG